MRKQTKKAPADTRVAAKTTVLGSGKKLGTADVAARLGCHPMTIPRLVKDGRLSAPVKWFGKNIWTEEQLATDLAKMLARASKSTEAA